LSDLERGARRAPYRDTAERLAAAPGLDGAERAALPRATTRRSGPRPLEQPVSSRFASLPSSLSSFVGRERERAEVRRLVAEPRTNERAANGWTMAQAMAALDREYGNLRAALKWLLEQSALVESAQRLAGVFGRFCFIRGYPAEGEARLKQALAAQGGDRPTM